MKRLFFIFFAISLYSCTERGYIKVQNKVHNARLENISWGDYSVGNSLLTGEDSGEQTIADSKESFPKMAEVSFYMVNAGKRVYLKTKAKYSLDIDEHLSIVISDTTAVLNPSL